MSGEPCIIRCDSKYSTPEGPPRKLEYTIMCDNYGHWTPTTLSCLETVCPPVTAGQFGYTQGSCVEAKEGQRCEIVCQRHYMGSKTGTCSDRGEWSPSFDKVICTQKQCLYERAEETRPEVITKISPVTTPIANGELTGLGCSNDTHPGLAGEYCTYSCNPGYALVGAASLFCDGTGDDKVEARYIPSKAPTCVAIRCIILNIHATPTSPGFNCSGNRFNSICIAYCIGQDLSPSVPTITCSLTGEWDPQPDKVLCTFSVPGPECPRNIFVKADNGQFQGQCNPGKANRTCTLFCDAGFQVAGNPDRKCIQDSSSSAHWDSETPPFCIPVLCPGLTAPSNSYTTGRCAAALGGQTCTFACNPGYVIGPVGVNPTLTCNDDGEWSGEVPVCMGKTCPPIKPPPGVIMNGICTPGHEGDICSFKCTAGQDIQGLPNVICNGDGTWSGPPPVCVAGGGGGTGSPGQPGGSPGCRPRKRCCPIPKVMIFLG